MATQKSTPHAPADAETRSPRLDKIDHEDVLQTKSRQLRALLFMTYGNSGECFRNMSNAAQDEYLWACADMADDVVKSLDELGRLASAERSAKGVQHG